MNRVAGSDSRTRLFSRDRFADFGSRRTVRRFSAVAVAAVALSGLVSACSSDGPGAQNGPYMVWDPYPQFGQSSQWSDLLTKCANENGASIRRSSYDASSLVGKEAAANQQGLSPDILVVSNQDVPALVAQHLLAPESASGLDASGVASDLLGVAQVSGSTYGLPIGTNTIALYYNKSILASSGVKPESITSWSSLTSALGKVKTAGKEGITFAADDGADAAFSFEPWLWGAGGSLADPSSQASVSALELWVNWVHDGYAPSSVAKDSLSASWSEFASGRTAFAENDVAQAATAGKLGFSYGVINIPAQGGGSAAPTPAGGETITIPVQMGTKRYAIDDKIVSCLASASSGSSIDGELSYLGATSAVQAAQVKKTPSLEAWTAVAKTVKAQTGDGVGAAYRTLSQKIGAAARSALDGSSTPEAALSSVK